MVSTQSINGRVKGYNSWFDKSTGNVHALSSFPRKRESSNAMRKQPAVYIRTSKRNSTLYIGVTSNLQKRVWEHKNDLVEGFTKRYGVHRLVYYEL